MCLACKQTHVSELVFILNNSYDACTGSELWFSLQF